MATSEWVRSADGILEIRSNGHIDEAQKWHHTTMTRDQPKFAHTDLGIEEKVVAGEADPALASGAMIPSPQSDTVGPIPFLQQLAREPKFLVVLFVRSLSETSYMRAANQVLYNRTITNGGALIAITPEKIRQDVLNVLKLSYPVYHEPTRTLNKRYRVGPRDEGVVVLTSHILDPEDGEEHNVQDYLETIYHWHACPDDKMHDRLEMRLPTPLDYVTLYGMGMKTIVEERFLHRRPSPDEVWKVLYAVLERRARQKMLAERAAYFKAKAIKRLMRDWREVERNPLPMIRCQPAYETDMFEWHATVRGTEGTPYHDVPYHMILTFPKNYPMQPPRVKMLTSIPHKNVFGSYICLDMLTDRTPDPTLPIPLYAGWTTAYGVQSILLQLQSFLFDGACKPMPLPEPTERLKECKTWASPWMMWPGYCGCHSTPVQPRCGCPNCRKAVQYHNSLIRSSVGRAKVAKCDCRYCAKNNALYDPNDEPEKPMPVLPVTAAVDNDDSEVVDDADWMVVASSDQLTHERDFDTFKPPVMHVDFFAMDKERIGKHSYMGQVVRLLDHGVGCLIDIGLTEKRTGRANLVFCHVSQIRQQFTKRIQDAVSVGDYVRCRVLEADKLHRRISVSCKGRMPPLEFAPDPSVLYEADLVGFLPDGGLRLTFGRVAGEGTVANDHALTKAIEAFGYGHFWHAEEVLRVGQKLWARLVDVDTSTTTGRNRLRFEVAQFVVADGGDGAVVARKDETWEEVPRALAFQVLDAPTREHVSALTCFHYKSSFRHDTLGLPLRLEHYDSGELSYVHLAGFDLIGQAAYEDGIRRVVSRATFTHWLPVYLDARHGEGLDVHEAYIARICRNPKEDRTDEVRRFHWSMVLKVLPTLLNSCVVTIMQGRMHESIAALSCYMMTYHLMAAFCQKYPDIQRSVDKRVQQFAQSEQGRVKQSCPSMGELLAFLCLSSYGWHDVGKALLQEVFARNAKWAIQKYPELEDVVPDSKIEQDKQQLEADYAAAMRLKRQDVTSAMEEAQRVKARRAIFLNYQRFGKSAVAGGEEIRAPVDDPDDQDIYEIPQEEEIVTYTDPNLTLAKMQQLNQLDRGRLVKTLQASLISLRLVIFHFDFVCHFRSTQCTRTPRETAQELRLACHSLERCYGRMMPSQESQWQQRVKVLKQIKSWPAFFHHLQLPCPSNEFLLSWLRQSVCTSLRLRYHRPSRRALERMLARRKAAAAQAAFASRLEEDGNDYGGAEYEFSEHDFNC